jgi:hypothetical protein
MTAGAPMPTPIPMPTFKSSLRLESDADVEKDVAVVEDVAVMEDVAVVKDVAVVDDVLELEHVDTMLDLILKPRLCNTPLMKPSPGLAGWVLDLKYEVRAVGYLLVIDVIIFTNNLCVGARVLCIR